VETPVSGFLFFSKAARRLCPAANLKQGRFFISVLKNP
jgi:hypothetical protein